MISDNPALYKVFQENDTVEVNGNHVLVYAKGKLVWEVCLEAVNSATEFSLHIQLHCLLTVLTRFSVESKGNATIYRLTTL